jgi:hypothetical protein
MLDLCHPLLHGSGGSEDDHRDLSHTVFTPEFLQEFLSVYWLHHDIGQDENGRVFLDQLPFLKPVCDMPRLIPGFPGSRTSISPGRNCHPRQ